MAGGSEQTCSATSVDLSLDVEQVICPNMQGARSRLSDMSRISNGRDGRAQRAERTLFHLRSARACYDSPSSLPPLGLSEGGAIKIMT